jgi:2'-5' RNA ligase
MADWPLHITLADVFAVELDINLERKLTSLLASHQPITLLAKGDSTLGTTKVTLIEENDRLYNLHGQIIDLLENNGAKFNTPEFTRAGFLPHSTIQKSKRLYEGDSLEISTISLIDMFPQNDWEQRKIVKNFKLGKS